MITIAYENNELTAVIYGELDHHTARKIREEIDERLTRQSPKVLVLDFSNVTFMDSSGIGLIMGRYKLINALGGEISIKGASEQMKRIMQLAGINRLANFV